MNRRDFLLCAAAGGAALSFPPAALSLLDTNPPGALPRPTALRAVGREGLIRDLGRAYRARRPEEDDPDILASAIRGEDPAPVSSAATGADSDAQIDRRIRGDFETGRTVHLDGWILSVTEARQCALYSILES